MAPTSTKYTDFEALRAEAVALRRAGLSRRQIRDRLRVGNDTLQRALTGEPAAEWSRRPNAKDDLRERARELRLQGWTYDRIQAELGCSKSSVSLWVRDLPRPATRKRPAGSDMQAAQLGRQREALARATIARKNREEAAAEIGPVTDHMLFVLGVGLYWAEGAKKKPGSYPRVIFVNSDPDMIKLFLDWLRLLDVEEDRIRFAVNIHESADVHAAEAFWAGQVGIPVDSLMKTSLKRHNPKTRRTNTGAEYHGCLRVTVRQSAEPHNRIEGWWYGIVEAAVSRPQ